MRFYVYELYDPVSLLPFYVGKGQGSRMTYHVWAVRRGLVPNRNPHLFYKIKGILEQGLEPLCKKVYETEREDLAFQKEVDLIALYRQDEKITLCNILPGGQGITGFKYTCSEDRKRKISEAKRGKRRSSEHNKNWIASHTGKVTSRETREKISKAHLGHTTSEETRRKISDARKGQHPSEETRKKLSEAKKGNKNATKKNVDAE